MWWLAAVKSVLAHWRAYLVLLLCVACGVSASLAYGFWRAKERAEAEERIVTLEKVVEVQKEVIKTVEARSEVEEEVQRMPEAPDQPDGRPPTIARAPAGTPARELCNEWCRN